MSEENMGYPAQRRKLGRGMVLSVAGVMVCWVPGLGALLALGGLFGVLSSYVPGYRARYAVYTMLSVICALVSVGALMAMLYVYFGNPELLAQLTDWLMAVLGIQ